MLLSTTDSDDAVGQSVLALQAVQLHEGQWIGAVRTCTQLLFNLSLVWLPMYVKWLHDDIVLKQIYMYMYVHFCKNLITSI